MRRRRLLVLVKVGALMLTGTSAGPDVPGDPTPPEITVQTFGTPRRERLVPHERHRCVDGF